MITHRTNEWYRARIGVFSASNFALLMAKPADKQSYWSKSALNSIERSVSELYFNDYIKRPDSDSTRWGLKYEREALELFCKRNDFSFEEIGFIVSDESKWIGATPDAKILNKHEPENVIIAEVKCPYNQKYFYDYKNKIIDSKTLKRSKSEYYWQIQGTMWVTKANYSYFIILDPRVSQEKSLHYVKIERDEEDINLLKKKLFDSLKYRDEILELVRKGIRKPVPLSSLW